MTYEQTASAVVRAPRATVYAALLDPDAVATWRVPADMTATVLAWQPREGGRFRVTLSYRDPARRGKSTGATDEYAGRFVRLVPDEQVVEAIAFDTDDGELSGEMTMTTTLRDVDGGTEVTLRHEGVPDAVPAADNRAGTQMALANLAAYVERTRSAG